jgi:hypothetical protein
MKTNKRIKLDWSRLVGFNQVHSNQDSHVAKRAKAVLAAKIGGKPAGGGGGGGAVGITIGQ